MSSDVTIAITFTITTVVTFDFKVEHDMRLRRFRDVYFLFSFHFLLKILLMYRRQFYRQLFPARFYRRVVEIRL